MTTTECTHLRQVCQEVGLVLDIIRGQRQAGERGGRGTASRRRVPQQARIVAGGDAVEAAAVLALQVLLEGPELDPAACTF